MRILIDMQGVQTGSRFRGIGRYTMAFVNELICRSDQKHDYVLLFNGQLQEGLEKLLEEFRGLVACENIKVWTAPAEVAFMSRESKWRREVAEYLRESVIANLAPDLILLTTVFEGFGDDFVISVGKIRTSALVVSILYDLIPLLNEDEYLTGQHVRDWYHRNLGFLKKSDLLLAISESSKKEAIDHLLFPEQNITNISAAADPIFSRSESCEVLALELRERFGVTREILSYTSATDPRKNHKRLIEAYASLPLDVRKAHQLVFIGGLPNEHKQAFLTFAENAGLGKDELVITGRVSDEEMRCLYRISKAFVFPSWHEGFGLPALEAMLCGCPVIASSTSSLPEVVGCKDALFEPFDVGSISEKINRVLTDKCFREALQSEQGLHAKRFSWRITAEKAIDAIESLFGKYKCSKHEQDITRIFESVYLDLLRGIASLECSGSDEELKLVAKCIAANELLYAKRRLLVDVSELAKHDSRTGIQRVTRSILKSWLSQSTPGLTVEPVYASEKQGYRYARRFVNEFSGVDCFELDEPLVEIEPGDIFIGLDLIHPQIALHNRNFYRSARERGGRVFFVVYDLIPLQFPEFANAGVPEGHLAWLDVVLESDGAICISQAVANDLILWAGNNRPETRLSKVSWFHLGADLDSSAPTKGFPVDADSVLNGLRRRPSFLMVGTLEPRKGHEQVLNAFDLLWKDAVDINLVIVGKQGWLVDGLVERLHKHDEINKRLFWLEAVSDEYLEEIYAACTCLVAASYGEGFGLPLIEAAQHKLPLIARDIPVFREVAGEHAYYFTATEPQQLVCAVTQWLGIFKNKEHPRSENIHWLTWNESANQLMQSIVQSQY